jgi:arylsulfatase A-like enzyme
MRYHVSGYFSKLLNGALFLLGLSTGQLNAQYLTAAERPNIVIIYTDDVGYGDLSAHGGKIPTPNIDKLFKGGLDLTNAHATASTCTPSRYSLLTGEYAWRRTGTGIARGNASLIIPVEKETMPRVLGRAGYKTGVVGKWHLGMGGPEGPDWNTLVKPGPNEIGFDYSYIMPATGDRVPCVYMENGRIINLSKDDPIRVDYDKNIDDEPTAISHPHLLKLPWTHGHNNSIVNGVGRIGFMKGGKSALWRDEDMADSFTVKATSFIRDNAAKPFFLYFATHDIHVPRVAHERFQGKSGFGPRGDVLLELDESVGRILKTLEELKLTKRTLVIFTSDNGPVLDDGYVDQAVEKLGDHKPWGAFRGGKYSAFEAGTRVPMAVSWPGGIKPGMRSDILFSQVDLLASFATMAGQTFNKTSARDTEDHWKVLVGAASQGRSSLTIEALGGHIGLLRADGFKYIPPRKGPAITNQWTNIETGNAMVDQLYQLKNDPGERSNIASTQPDVVTELKSTLESIRK